MKCARTNSLISLAIRASLLLVLGGLFGLGAAAAQATGTAQSSPSAELSNRAAVFSFDPDSGALVRIHNLDADRSVAFTTGAAAPVRLWLGTEDDPDAAMALVSPGKQELNSMRKFDFAGGQGLELHWKNLKTETGEASGVALTLVCEVDESNPFLRMRVRINNMGHYLITGIFLGLDQIDLGVAPEAETYTVPQGMGYHLSHPREAILGQELLYTIPPTVPRGMYASWLDVSAPGFGIASGYFNLKGMDMLGDAQFEETGIRLGWRLFRLSKTWTFMDDIKSPLIYPLARGEDFVSDEFFLGLHAGDWHTTADYYRSEYERVFAGDFLPYEKLSPAAQKADLVLNSTAAWGVMSEDNVKHDLSRGEVRSKFLEVPGLVKKRIEELGAHPENCLLVMLGQTTHWGIYKLPDYFPVNAEAGGPEDFKEMIRQLREDIGVSGTHFYAHATFNHPDADYYVEEADTGWAANLYANYDHLGNIACMDSEGWWRHWRDNIIPGFVQVGASGIEFDEGFGHHFICDQPGHLHSQGAESILTAQLRGALRIIRECRRAFGSDGYLESEGGSDVGARHFDLWEGTAKGDFEVVRYTHPDKPYVVFASDPEDIVRSFVFGAVVINHVNSGIWPEHERFIKLRRQARDEAAPGYPYGFKDSIGLQVSHPDIIAKVYANDDGLTITYYATSEAAGEIVVDGASLNHQKIGLRTIEVDLAPLEFGYQVLKQPKTPS